MVLADRCGGFVQQVFADIGDTGMHLLNSGFPLSSVKIGFLCGSIGRCIDANYRYL